MTEHTSEVLKITYNESMVDLSLRTQHSRLHFQASHWQVSDEGLALTFTFHLEPNLTFTTTTLLHGVTAEQVARIPRTVIDWYVFNIGMVESFSYWKLSCAPEIIIEAGFLTPAQEAWWHDLLIQGLGEFFYVNDINFSVPDFVKFSNAQAQNTGVAGQNSVKSIKLDQNIKSDINLQSNIKIMIPIGGGKDSVVTLDVLQKAGWDASRAAVMQLYPTPAARNVSHVSGLPQILLSRHLDPQLSQLNQQGYYNGHTPFSALLAFLSNLAALLWGYDYVAVSNERSSNEGNVMFHGQEINHQYSKTYEFETKFREYLAAYGPSGAPEYFSFVRPLYELQIAQIFSQMTQYHPIFRSCNVGRQTNDWCGHCAKCLFAYLILGAVMPIAEVRAIFGQDLLAKLELKPVALELLGYAEQKPLECVGTHEETKVAMWMIIQQYQQQAQTLPALLAELATESLAQEIDMAHRTQTILLAWNGQHHVPPALEELLKGAVKAITHA